MPATSEHLSPPGAFAQALWHRADALFDMAFGSAANPLRHLGALGLLLFWLLALSGIYLYAALDTSVDGAWRSIEHLSREQWYLGGVLRSVHRYAADGFVVVVVLHLLREGMFARFLGFRRWSWLTGVPLLPLVFVCAIGGFWLNWDRLGQYSATATAEWLDVLPFFATPLTRNFVAVANVGDRLFTLFVFIHLGVPLLLVFGLWTHLQRISHAEVWPARALALGTLATLLLLAGVLPVQSQPPADLSSVPAQLPLDWLLLFIHPLVGASSGELVWTLLAAALLGLCALPLLPHARAPVARVDPANCSGCRRCFDDCPYAAITMVPHPNGRRELAVVDAARCASCGICAGACPSATPFRGIATLLTGIDMPQRPIDALRRELQDGLARSGGAPRYVVFSCERGARVETLAAPDVLTASLLCSAMLPPSFIDYALRQGAAGVLVASCADGGCEFRLGPRWTDARLAGQREPHLRSATPLERVQIVHADRGDEARLEVALARLRRGAQPAPATERPAIEAPALS